VSPRDQQNDPEYHEKLIWLDKGVDGYPPVPRLPERLVATSTTAEDLKRHYRRSLHEIAGKEEQLRLEEALEDEYREAVERILCNAGAQAHLPHFTGPLSFSGGADDLERLMQIAAARVSQAAVTTGFPAIPLYCALWPDRHMNARSVSVSGGTIAYVNTGLLVMLRIACQYVASSLGTLYGAESWGADRKSQEQVSTELLVRIHNYRRGIDPRTGERVKVLRGPREKMRRQLNYLAIAYVIAHELGHALASKYDAHLFPEADEGADGERDPAHLSVAGVRAPRTEEDEVGSGRREWLADWIALRIMETPPLAKGGLSKVSVMAPSLVMGLQAALWWKDRREGSTEFGWSHPLPEMRMWSPLLKMAPDEDSQVHREGRRFLEWLTEVLYLDKSPTLAVKQALAGKDATINRFFTLLILGVPQATETTQAGEDDAAR
jgi:hypothetical protein